MQELHQESFGEWLRDTRKASRLSQTDLAERLGVSSQYLSNIERSQIDVRTDWVAKPSLKMLAKLPKALELPREVVFAAAGHFYGQEFVEGFVEPDRSQEVITFSDTPPADAEAFAAFFEGLPPNLQREEYQRLKKLWQDHRAGRLQSTDEDGV